MRNLLLLISILLYSSAFAQRNIRSEILNYQDSTFTIIDNGRQLVIDKIINNDPEKANEIFLYLINETNPDYVAFYPAEAVIVSIATHNFKQFISLAKNIKDFNKDKKKFPLYSDIYAELHAYMHANKDQIFNTVNSAALSDIEKNYIRIYLDYYFNKDKLQNRQQIRKVINKNPQGPFVPYLKQMKGLCTVAKMEMGLGYQHSFISGNLANTIHPESLSLFMIEIDFMINRTYISIYAGGNLNKVTTQKELTLTKLDETYPKGKKAHILQTGFAFGYLINPKSKIKTYPYVDFGILCLDAKSKEYEENENNIFAGFMPGIGIKSDIVFRSKKTKREIFYMKPNVAYHTIITKKDNFKGNMFSISLAIGVTLGPNL